MTEADPERQKNPATDSSEKKKKSNSTEWTLAIVTLLLGVITLITAF